jgi:hypothetical protein
MTRIKQKMKIGIMTFWWSENNYGQILQCYALQKYLCEAGHDAYLIRYDPRNDYIKKPNWIRILNIFNPIKLTKYFLFKTKEFRYKNEIENNPRYFDRFRKKHIKQSEHIYYSYRELVENPPEADVYIVGSDQVWNYTTSDNTIHSQRNAFFLNFGSSKTIRIAYAASFTKKWIHDDIIQLISPLLKNFKYVSVREKTGLDICHQCGIHNAEWVADPTMLLDVDAYRFLYKNEIIKKPENPYCLLYMIDHKQKFSVKKVYSWAQEKKLEVVYITGNFQFDKYNKTFATIPQWIYFIEHAEYIITNSYHGAIFSLFFQKKFAVIPLLKKESVLNTRVISIFEIFGIEPRFIAEDFSVLDVPISWGNIQNKMRQMRGSCSLLDVIADGQ